MSFPLQDTNEATGTTTAVAVTAPAGQVALDSSYVWVAYRVDTTDGGNPTATGWDRLNNGFVNLGTDRLRLVTFHYTLGVGAAGDFSSTFPSTTSWWYAVYLNYNVILDHVHSTPLVISQGSGQVVWTGAPASISVAVDANASDINDIAWAPIGFAIWTPNSAASTWTTEPADFTQDFETVDITTGLGGNVEHCQMLFGNRFFHDHGVDATDLAADTVAIDSGEVAGRGLLQYVKQVGVYVPPAPPGPVGGNFEVPQTKLALKVLPHKVAAASLDGWV